MLMQDDFPIRHAHQNVDKGLNKIEMKEKRVTSCEDLALL